MKEKFYQYYLFQLIWFNFLFIGYGIIISLIRWIGGKEVFFFESLAHILAISTALAMIIGGMYQFYFEYYKPRRIRKVIQKESLRFLTKLGFSLDKKDYHYSGYYNNFYLLIHGNNQMNGGDSLVISVFISPNEKQIDYLDDLPELYKLNFDDEAEFCWLTSEISFSFGRITSEKFKKRLKKIMDILISENIQPQKFED